MRKKYLVIALLLFASVVPLVPLFSPGLPATHDGRDHVARIANFYQSLSEGHIVPRWAGNLNWGYGHPILMFLYPLPSYLAAGLHAAGWSLVDSTKLVFGLAFVASVAAFFVWARVQWGVIAALTGAIFYGLSPYRFVDLYVRGALGEHVAFIFPPIIFWGLLMLARGRRWGRFVVALSAAGLMLSHNAISLMVFPLVALYALYLYFFETKRNVRFLLTSCIYVLMGFALSAFFWIPALIEGKYTLRYIVTAGEFGSRFVPWTEFISTAWSFGGTDQLSKSLGPFGVLAVAGAAAILFFAKTRKEKILTAGILTVLAGSLFMMTHASGFLWGRIALLQNFQFPWRFLTLSVIAIAAAASALVSGLSGRLRFVVACVLIIGSIAASTPMWRVRSYSFRPESFYAGVYDGTTDTGESSPIWSVRFMEHRASAPAEVIHGDADILPVSRSSARHTYRIVVRKKSRIVENTLYFPGWTISANGTPVSVEFQDPAYRGLMTYWLESGQYTVVVGFGDTKLRTIANVASIMGLLFILAAVGEYIWVKRRH